MVGRQGQKGLRENLKQFSSHGFSQHEACLGFWSPVFLKTEKAEIKKYCQAKVFNYKYMADSRQLLS